MRIYANKISNEPGLRGIAEIRAWEKADKIRCTQQKNREERGDALLPRHERLVLELMTDPTMNVSHAAERAKYTRPRAHAILKRPEVKMRIREMQEEIKQKADITLDMLRERLIELSNEAQDAGSYSAAIHAVELLMKHMGGFVEKSQVEIKRTNLSEEELDAEIERLQRIGNGSKTTKEVDK